MIKARIQAAWRHGDEDGRPGWCLQLRYDEELVRDLKRRVPFEDRTWDKVEKTWWVSVDHEDALEALLPDFGQYRRQPQLL